MKKSYLQPKTLVVSVQGLTMLSVSVQVNSYNQRTVVVGDTDEPGGAVKEESSRQAPVLD